MQPIVEWLGSLGLSEYADRFAENDIDESVLPDLTDQHLKDLGVSLGHRLKMLRAIAALNREASAKLPPAAAPEPKPRDEAERRQLTVMFCDLVGSTELSTKLDPEDLRSVIDAYHHCTTELVEGNGGFVAKYMGDGVLTYFGYPRAHEHDTERAVRTALNLVEAVPKLATNAGSPLQVRVGIATGLVVVGDLIGAGAAREQAVVGETPNLAARLQALAAPGAVVISSSTRRLTGGLFEYRDLGTVALKGFGANVPAWQVIGLGAAESRFEALRATTTPLVGRGEEIDLLISQWEQVKRGDGQAVLISGEPGIGKSRIAETILQRLSNEPHIRLRYFCSPHHQDSALYPSIAQLERAAGFRREDTADQRLDKLEAVLAQGTNDLGAAVPLLADLLSIPTGDRYPPLNLTPQKRKEKTLYAQLTQLEGLAAQLPVLMVWEDLHWSDPTTRESLDLLIDRVATLRVLVIITFRPEFAPLWIGRPHVTMLNLNRLPLRQRAEMIAHVTGGKILPKEIADQIMDRTDGVPLFIEELTKSVVESGIVADTGDRYAIVRPMGPLVIPTSLHASLLARLDRLAPTREIAQTGAALGRSFSHELISAVVQMPRQQLDDALAQLVAAELIFQRGTSPDAEYAFKHALVQDAAYSTLLRSSRRQLHARIAAALESQFRDLTEMQPEVLARHCAEAGLAEKAVNYLLKAGRQGVARGAMIEAARELRKGLKLLSGEPDGRERQRQELDLQLGLGEAVIATAGLSSVEALEVYARARHLCETLNLPAELRKVLTGQYSFHVVRAELDQAEDYAAATLRLGESGVVSKHTGLIQTGIVRFWRGKFTEARAMLEDGLTAPSESPLESNLTLLYLSHTLLHLGHIEQARLRRDEVLAQARRQSPYELAWTLCEATSYGDIVEGTKSVETILRSSEEALAISGEHGFTQWLLTGYMLRGWCLGALGQATAGIPQILKGLEMSHSIGTKLTLPWYLTLLAETYGRAGQYVESLDRIGEAMNMIESTGERCVEAETHRIRGSLLLSINEHRAAEESFRRSLQISHEQNARFWRLRAAASLARLWRDQGKRVEGRDLLAPVYGWFTEGLDAPVLRDAKALLDQLG